jgi:hypothetical protein
MKLKLDFVLRESLFYKQFVFLWIEMIDRRCESTNKMKEQVKYVCYDVTKFAVNQNFLKNLCLSNDLCYLFAICFLESVMVITISFSIKRSREICVL